MGALYFKAAFTQCAEPLRGSAFITFSDLEKLLLARRRFHQEARTNSREGWLVSDLEDWLLVARRRSSQKARTDSGAARSRLATLTWARGYLCRISCCTCMRAVQHRAPFFFFATENEALHLLLDLHLHARSTAQSPSLHVTQSRALYLLLYLLPTCTQHRAELGQDASPGPEACAVRTSRDGWCSHWLGGKAVLQWQIKPWQREFPEITHCMDMRRSWACCREREKHGAGKQRLVEVNVEDCRARRHVCNCLLPLHGFSVDKEQQSRNDREEGFGTDNVQVLGYIQWNSCLPRTDYDMIAFARKGTGCCLSKTRARLDSVKQTQIPKQETELERGAGKFKDM